MEKETSKLTIEFNNADDKNHCFETNGSNLNIMVESRTHTHGSSLVTLKSLVDYRWDIKEYPGRLLAVHKNGQVIAYSINVNGQGMVRVTHLGMNQRLLLKGMAKEVLDLEFAFISPEIIIGCIEETALHVYKLNVTKDSMTSEQLLKIESPLDDHVPRLDKISWCPYVPENSDEVDEFSGKLLVWVRGSKFECYSIKTVLDTYKTGTFKSSNIKEGLVKFYENTSLITCARFSPDGTTLSVSTENGQINFYQIYFYETTPRWLHKWTPHNGASISSLFFLDNHTLPIPGNTLWKYAITCGENNTEIKVSSCESWETLQTITFKSKSGIPLNFKAEIDRSSSFLVLSDQANRQIYVLQICKDSDILKLSSVNGSDLSPEENCKQSSETLPKVCIKTIAKFNLSSPILSYGIANANIKKSKCAMSDNYLIDELEDYDEENNAPYCVQLDMFLVQPKSMQQCCIKYQTALNKAAEVLQTESFVDTQNVSMKSTSEDEKSFVKIDESELATSFIKSPPQKTTQLNLLTPDSFSSPVDLNKKAENNVSQEVMSAIFMLAKTTTAKATSPQAIPQKPLENVLNLVKTEENLLKQSQVKIIPIEQTVAPPQPQTTGATSNANVSGGSSPSREVREILSLKGSATSDCGLEYCDDSDNNLEKDEFKVLLNDLNCGEFKNIDDDFDDDENNEDEDDGNEEDNEDDDDDEEDESDGKKMKETLNTSKTEWPKAPEVPLINENARGMQRGPDLSKLEDRMTKMIEIMEQQSRYIAELRHEIYNLKEKQNADTMIVKNIAVRSEENIRKVMDETYSRHERQNHQKFEQLMLARDRQNRELQEKITQIIHQVIVNQMTEKLTISLSSELQRTLFSAITCRLEAIKLFIHRDITEKFATNETVIKDSLLKICANEQFINALAQSVLTGINKSVESSFRRTIEQSMIPSYEKISREMYNQLGRTFTEGTVQYTKAFESYMKQYGAVEERTKELNDSIQMMPQMLKQQNESSLIPVFKNSVDDIRKKMEKLEVNLVKDIKDQVKNEIQNGFEQQQSNLEDSVLSVFRSQAHTPAPTSVVESQDQIKQLLAHGQIEKAFHTALIANDLTLVDFTIEHADLKKVFVSGGLSQNILLSLIQQLTADTQNYNELKNKYVHEAVLSLDMRDSVTREHAPKIMQDLIHHFQAFIAANPHNPLNSNIKMIMLAAHSIVQAKSF